MVLSGGRGLTYRAVPQDGYLPVAHQRHDRTPPRGARKSAGRRSSKISRGAGRGGPGEGQWLTEATQGKPKENQNKPRAPGSPRDHNTATVGRGARRGGQGRGTRGAGYLAGRLPTPPHMLPPIGLLD